MILRRKLYFSVLAVSLFIFTACGSGEIEVQDDPEFTNLVGILEEQKSSDDRAGTHILTTSTGEEILVNSVAINLSGDQYLGNEVELTGVMNGDVFSVSGVSVVSVTKDQDSDDSLELYKNSEFGFQIGYFSDWKVVEGGSSVQFNFESEENTASVFIDHYTFSYEQSVFDTENEDSPLSNFMAKNYPEITDMTDLVNYIGIDGQEAVKIEEDDSITYYLYRNGFIYEITFTSDGDFENQFNEMISEFRFIGFAPENSMDDGESDSDEEVTSDAESLPEVDYDFTEFDSLSYEFKASYPSSWYYAGTQSTESGVLRHYGFSDEAIEDGKEILSLDLISGTSPSGTSINVDGKKLTLVSNSDSVEIYTIVDGRTYKLAGPKEYENVLKVMATSIEKIKAEDIE